MDDLLCSNAFALVQFTVSKHGMMLVETKQVFPLKSARRNKETPFSYDKKWKITVHQGPVKGGKAKNFEITILLLSNKYFFSYLLIRFFVLINNLFFLNR